MQGILEEEGGWKAQEKKKKFKWEKALTTLAFLRAGFIFRAKLRAHRVE